MTTDTSDLGPAPDDDHDPDTDRVERLTEQLAGIYDYRRMAELEKEDPERAQEHRDAAQELVSWLTGLPREERRAAFSRGWEKAKERRNERAEERIAELEELVASAGPAVEDDEPSQVVSWRRAQQDPRFDMVLQEAERLDRYDGSWVIPRPLARLLAARVMTAILKAEEAEDATPPTLWT